DRRPGVHLVQHAGQLAMAFQQRGSRCVVVEQRQLATDGEKALGIVELLGRDVDGRAADAREQLGVHALPALDLERVPEAELVIARPPPVCERQYGGIAGMEMELEPAFPPPWYGPAREPAARDQTRIAAQHHHSRDDTELE